MASEASRRYEAALAGGAAAPQQAPQFEASDLESLQGRWDIVACLDVLIHYDQVCLLSGSGCTASCGTPGRSVMQAGDHKACSSLQTTCPFL